MRANRSSEQTGRYPIRVVAERTGLTPAAIRAWERRYAIVAPARSEGAQRLYTDADVERLRLVTGLASAGYSLADLARRPTATLARMAAGADIATSGERVASTTTAPPTAAAVERMVEHARVLDSAALRAALMQSVLELGPVPAMEQVLSPLLSSLGEGWACGDVSVAEEHLASGVVRDVLGWVLQSATPGSDAPTLVATTIAGEAHEFGAMMAAVVAAVAGWRVIYLGPNTPADALARAVRDAGAQALAIGIVADEAADDVKAEVAALRRAIGSRTKIVAGGASAANHRLSLKRARVEIVESRADFRRWLNIIWTREL